MKEQSGAVYDRGYQPYDGAPGDRRAACWALYRASLRRALGLRRSWKQKALPTLLILIATLPSFLMVGVGFLTRNQPDSGFEFITYREQAGLSSTLLLYVALTAPDLICPDRRQRVLALLLSRPLTSVNYVLVKVAAVTTCVFAFSFIPQVVLFLGQTGVNNRPRHYIAQNAEILWQAPLACALLALFYGCLGIAFATLTSRRVIATASIIGSALISTAIGNGLADSAGGEGGHPASLISLVDLPLNVNDIVFLGKIGPDSPLRGADNDILLAILVYSAVVVVSVGVLLWNYRPSRAGSHL
jgi:ABC-type transport system involved in multi-copper enzyme maturation permease subunit